MRTTALRASRSAALVLLATALPLTACSSSSTSYCDALTAAAQEWSGTGITLQDPVQAARLVVVVKRVEAVAPEEVKADWTALVGLFEKLSVPNADISALTQQMQGFQTAAKRVETHAKEACGIDLAR